MHDTKQRLVLQKHADSKGAHQNQPVEWEGPSNGRMARRLPCNTMRQRRTWQCRERLHHETLRAGRPRYAAGLRESETASVRSA